MTWQCDDFAQQLVVRTQALLWTDGRYHLQAEQQLGAGWTLMRAGKPSVPSIKEFLAKQLPSASVVGFDPFVHSAAFVKDLEKVSVALKA